MLQPARPLPDRLCQLWGTVTDVSPGVVQIAGVSEHAGLGNEITIETAEGVVSGEILKISTDRVIALLFGDSDIVRIGDRATIEREALVAPGDHWIGQVINYRGEILGDDQNNSVATPGPKRKLITKAPPSHARKSLGPRLKTGLMITDTILPLCHGQRLGLFAGSGIGKSTLLGTLANGVEADRIVIALIGERSREVNDFANHTLPKAARDKAVIVTATSSEPPGAKKRAAYCAMAAAEHFRDQGHHVLLLFDSITRFAEAHREVALTGGETPALNAFPPSTVRVIAELAERAGPGTQDQGDITAIFSVLVAGSDMEEPVADMIRGILDGHIILSREIAERGRYPAIDVLRSVSRALPRAASEPENKLIKDYLRTVSLYEELAPMLRANLYERGIDKAGDFAIDRFPELDAFVSQSNEGDIASAFEQLQSVLAPETAAKADKKPAT
ncbi:FliI/YscN family ATPase [Henriciella litoralis]|uniref:FliI/YscN family ATPase n=1 Tax=Henriciella litoralis TaxID=568102 RepID=UPI000A0682FE|nr:FliI/YscN family ATPase [Henriciella litoralis]